MDPQQSTLEKERLAHASSEDLREEIRGTRRSMDETLDELGERLHPRHLLDDVIDLFRGTDSGAATRGKMARASRSVGQTIAREIKERPLPALLVGAGLVWWIFDAASGDDDHTGAQTAYRPAAGSRPASDAYAQPAVPSYYTGGAPDAGGISGSNLAPEDAGGPGLREKATGAVSAAGEKISGAVSAAGERLSAAGSAVSSAAQGAMQSMRGAGDRAAHYGSTGRGALRDRVGRAEDRLRYAGDEHPLAMGGVCLAAGLLVGLLLPRSEREDEWLGETSDQLRKEARQRGEELVARGKSVATQTASAALDTAEERGLTAGNILEKAGRVFSDAAQAAHESAQREGVDPSKLAQDAKAVASTAKETAQTSARDAGGS